MVAEGVGDPVYGHDDGQNFDVGILSQEDEETLESLDKIETIVSEHQCTMSAVNLAASKPSDEAVNIASEQAAVTKKIATTIVEEQLFINTGNTVVTKKAIETMIKLTVEASDAASSIWPSSDSYGFEKDAEEHYIKEIFGDHEDEDEDDKESVATNTAMTLYSMYAGSIDALITALISSENVTDYYTQQQNQANFRAEVRGRLLDVGGMAVGIALGMTFYEIFKKKFSQK